MSMAIMCWKPRMAAGMNAIFSSRGKNVGGWRVDVCVWRQGAQA
jgi:hypothetical protein